MLGTAITDTFVFDMNGPLTAIGAADPVRTPYRVSPLTGPLSAVAALARTESLADMNGPFAYGGPAAPAPRRSTPVLMATPLSEQQIAGLATVGAAMRGRTWTEINTLATALAARVSPV